MPESSAELDIPLAQNTEAEVALLSSCMQSRGAYAEVESLIEPEMFWRPAHGTIWTAIEAVARSGRELSPMTVMAELRSMQELTRVGGGAYLHTIVSTLFHIATPSTTAIQIRQAWRARRALQHHQRMAQVMIEHADDHGEMLYGLARENVAMELLVDEADEDRPIEGLENFDAFMDRPRAEEGIRWLVPNLIMAQDVFMILAGEGGGKSQFTRQLCLCIASGMHPFHPDRFVTPMKTLHIDLENPEGLVASETADLRQQIQFLGGYRGENAFIWHRPQGLNLRDRGDARLLERVIAESEARLVTIGSLYKAFSRKGDSWDQAAEETREVFDRLRARYDLAFVIEHHMPKGEGGASYDRPQTAFGSQQWAGWASVGRIINQVGENMFRFDQFRRDRGRREMPVGLVRGGELPWSPIWDKTELEFGMYPELQEKIRKARGTKRGEF